jgi:hypothetical protein
MSDENMIQKYNNFLEDLNNLSHFPDLMSRIKDKITKYRASSKQPLKEALTNPFGGDIKFTKTIYNTKIRNSLSNTA